VGVDDNINVVVGTRSNYFCFKYGSQ